MSFNPDWTVAPGEVLREKLVEMRWTQVRLAQATGYSTRHITDVINGYDPITLPFALALEAATGISAEFWLCSEAHFRVGLVKGRRAGR